MAIKYFILLSNVLRSHSREFIPLIRTWLLMAGDGFLYSCVFASPNLEEQSPRSRYLHAKMCVCVHRLMCEYIYKGHIHNGMIVAWIHILGYTKVVGFIFLKEITTYLDEICTHLLIGTICVLLYEIYKWVHQAYSMLYQSYESSRSNLKLIFLFPPQLKFLSFNQMVCVHFLLSIKSTLIR